MLQQIIALIVIAFFLSRLVWQKQKKQISPSEFLFWLIFWIIAGAAIIGLKLIDRLAADLGFSGSGIDILIYAAVVVLFYFIFRLRLRQEKTERDITKIIREITIKK